jgi:hypothetical protein
MSYEENMAGTVSGKLPLQEVWHEMMTADVFIASSSTFSAVPAILNRDGIVVYQPIFYFSPLPGWEVPDRASTLRYKLEKRRLREQCKPPGAGADIYGTLKRQYNQELSGVVYLLRHGPQHFMNAI